MLAVSTVQLSVPRFVGDEKTRISISYQPWVSFTDLDLLRCKTFRHNR